MDPLRWQSWHFSCKIGAISLANVGSAASEGSASVRRAPKASAPIPRFRREQKLVSLMVCSSYPCLFPIWLGSISVREKHVKGGKCQESADLFSPACQFNMWMGLREPLPRW